MVRATSNQQVVDDFVAAYNAADWTRLEGYLGPDFVHHVNNYDYDSTRFIKSVVKLRRSIPDFHLQAECVVSQDDMVAVRWVALGTHTGSLEGEKPTGRSVDLHGMTMFRIVGDVVAEEWEVKDLRHLTTETSPFPGFDDFD
jgi:predicted ester cyclase